MITATTYPTHCPHGTEQVEGGTVWMNYADGCWTTGAGSLVARLFHLDENASRSISAVDYLTAWSEALREENARWMTIRKREDDEANYLQDWAEALVLNAGDEVYDEALAMEHAEYLGEVPWTDRVED